MEESRYVQDAILDRMIQFSDGDGGAPQIASFGTANMINVTSLVDKTRIAPKGDYAPQEKSNLAFWTREWGDGDGNASSTRQRSGFVSGMDA